MAKSKREGGLYLGINGKYHDANGKPIPADELPVVPTSLLVWSEETPPVVEPEGIPDAVAEMPKVERALPPPEPKKLIKHTRRSK